MGHVEAPRIPWLARIPVVGVEEQIGRSSRENLYIAEVRNQSGTENLLKTLLKINGEYHGANHPNFRKDI